ncbi:alanyl-tRNA editing protein [Acinetobacter sp. ANC 4633]|uniref:alanyl-tRNA editing protein n=1 Tax=Acinetobacter sp. ANC 4633 TaxID=2529845 RepID=UPI00103AE064|nr:alanyl-tRNA editing protein [Acinetobacter sp. ANC 4633]TCB28640.1 alanyl-tRNA editing protein [Acinetobacter sp. ANC 4633]
MTEALYLSGATQGRVEVLSCEPDANGTYQVRLSATPFHPQGGGQPSDVGFIDDVAVTHVALQDGEIVHICTEAIALGQAQAIVDVEKRQLYSRLHSAGHLIGHVLQQAGWQPIKAQHWVEDAKVQFVPQEQAQTIELPELENWCNQYVTAGLITTVKQNADGYREVSFGEFSAFPCGGTHVENLAEIEHIQIQKLQLKKGKLTVNYTIVSKSAA